MKTISECTVNDIAEFSEEIAGALDSAQSFESAAQRFAIRLVERFDTIALARVFGTVAYDRLPEAEREFAASLAAEISLFPTTEVLTLFGTAGVERTWHDRYNSKGHLAIPLLSRRSIDEAPMISKLLNDLHFAFDAEGPESRPDATRAYANANAVCYIPDAATTVDILGRPIIPAAEFVRDYGIRTVIGVGGSYVVSRMFVAIVLFTRESIARETAVHISKLSDTFKSVTTTSVRGRYLFEPREDSRTDVM